MIDTLSPAERLAFVLHDMFGLPFEEIGPMVGRTPQATRQLASRARRRVQGAGIPTPERDLARQRAVVERLLRRRPCRRPRRPRRRAAPRRRGSGPTSAPAARAAPPSSGGPRRSPARRAWAPDPAAELHPALVNGAAGVVITLRGRPVALLGFTVADDKIVEIDAIGDPERVRRLSASVLEPLL